MATSPLPPRPDHSILAGGGGAIDAVWFRFVKEQADAIRDLQDRLSIKLVSAWPTTAADLPAGQARLFKNGATVRLYVNDGGTMKSTTLT